MLRVVATLWIVASISACSSPEEKAKSHYDRGMKLLAAKDYPKAAVEFKSALQKKKEWVDPWRGLAQVEEHNNNWPGVAAIMRTVVELDPKDLDSRLKLARLLLLANEVDDASKVLDGAGDANARNSGVLALRAAVELKHNDSKSAARDAEAALSVDPSNTEALIVLAAERMGRNDLEGALKLLNGAPAIQSDQLGVQLFKIKLYERMGNQPEVEAVLRKLVELHPEEPSFRKQLVRYYVDQKRLDAAETEVRGIAQRDPANSEAGLDVVRFLSTFKGLPAAKEELNKRIAAGGDVFPYQLTLADLSVAEGNTSAANELLEKLVAGASSDEQLRKAQIKLAELDVATKKSDAAEALIAKILAKDERNAAALKMRATLHMERGQFEPAVADLRQALHDQPHATDLMMLLALVYERSGQIELADRQYTDALRTSNSDPAVGLDYVAFLRRRGSTGQAEDVLKDLLSHAPNNVAVLSVLAEVRLAQQNWVGAQEVADTLRKLDKGGAAADQILAVALSGQKRYDESIGILQSAYAASPGNSQSMYSLVSALMRAQKSEQATAFLQTILDKEPTNVDARVLMAEVQLANNKPAEALASLQAAIKQQPKNIAAYRVLANLYLQQNKPDDALAALKQGLQQQPDSGALQLASATVLERKGDFDAAIAIYEDIEKKQPGSMIVANNLASLLSDHRTDTASQERAHTLALSLRKADVPQFKDTLGWVYFKEGNYKDALPLLEEAVRALPNEALARYHLAMTYRAMGDSAKATEQLTKALAAVACAGRAQAED